MKPSLDYYTGRPVEAVETVQHGNHWEWTIRFPGNVRIQNTDERRTSPPDVMGKVYLGVILSETDTQLLFGHYDHDSGDPVTDETVVLTPTQYSISDERFEGGPHFPQRLDDEEANLLPPDPSTERVADGPENPPEGLDE